MIKRSMLARMCRYLCLCLAVMLPVYSAGAAESAAQRQQRMAWFGEARFGMFIHWGIYAQLAGNYHGTPTKGAGEWIMESLKIPASEYEKLVTQFNPTKFDARQWVQIAKNAGMKYIVITSKHHDGFCMFDTRQTPYNISHTPFGRDPMKELAAACQAKGIRLCFYHSIMDWHHPDYSPRRPWNDTATGTPDMDRYVKYMKAELTELLSNYGPIGIMWFDGEWEKTWDDARGRDLYDFVRSLQPDVIVNNRVAKARKGMSGLSQGDHPIGDYGTPEQEIPATGQSEPWETCMTMNDTWGWKKDDHHWKSTQTLLRNLIDIASKGGNYLLNVGPTEQGEIPQESVQRLKEIGKWMQVNGQAIYGTSASPFANLQFGRCTQKPGKLFLEVFDWPTDGRLTVPMSNAVRKAYLLAEPTRDLPVESTAAGAIITVPAAAPGEIASVVVVELVGPVQPINQPSTAPSAR
jgi:alpha-L-fucosidase